MIRERLSIDCLFQRLNADFFGGELPQVPIYINAQSTLISTFDLDVSTVYARKAVQDYQIRFSDHLYSANAIDAAAEMLHQMCHLYNAIHGIKDTSRGGTYHNKKFRITAEAHALIVSRDSKYGWSITTASEKLRKYCDQKLQDLNLGDVFRFTHYKEDEIGATHHAHSIRYVCPKCGLIVRATREVSVKCAECDVLLVATHKKTANYQQAVDTEKLLKQLEPSEISKPTPRLRRVANAKYQSTA